MTSAFSEGSENECWKTAGVSETFHRGRYRSGNLDERLVKSASSLSLARAKSAKALLQQGVLQGGGGGWAAGALMRCAETHLEGRFKVKRRRSCYFSPPDSFMQLWKWSLFFSPASPLRPLSLFLPQNVYERSAALGSLLSWVFVKGRQGFFLFF